MKNDADPNRFLDNILEELSPPSFRAEMLERTLEQVRRKRRMRQWNHGLLATAVVVMAGFLAWRIHAPKIERPESPAATVNMISSRPLNPSMIVESNTNFLHTITSLNQRVELVQTGSYNYELRELNDDELLAMLDGQPALLVRKSLHQAELLIVDSTTRVPHLVEER